jgi:hypothetical protein
MWHPRSQTKIPFRIGASGGREFWTWQDLLAELLIKATRADQKRAGSPTHDRN